MLYPSKFAAMAVLTWSFTLLTAFAAFTEEQAVLLVGGDDFTAKVHRIAIVGAGAGGASAAYHLSRFAQSSSIPINLTIFERNPYIGGRSTTVNAYNDSTLPVELGASIFVEANQILVDAVDRLNLSTSSFSKRDTASPPGPEVGIWDGKKFHITYSGSWWDLAKLFWKYGYAPIRTQQLMKKTVGKFTRMYDAPVFPFASLTQAAQDVGLLAVTAATGEQYMRENRITGTFGRDVVQASTRVNYAQNLGFIHGLEAMVCMATDGAMQVEGGNWQIFDGMITASGAATMLETDVTRIDRQDNGLHLLSFKSNNPNTDLVDQESRLFDSVILAAPYQFSNITGSPHLTSSKLDKIPYVSLHVTLFTSPHLISPTYFGLSSSQSAPHVILTTLPDDERPQQGPAGVGSPGFFSISLLRPIVNPHTGSQEYLYKVFSPAPPTPEFITRVLGVEHLPGNDKDQLSERDVSWLYRKVWNSYPYEFPRVTFEDAEIGPDLWYTSGMDSFISTMETNALMGKNVARLVVDRLEGSR